MVFHGLDFGGCQNLEGLRKMENDMGEAKNADQEGQRLRGARIMRGLSQNDLAKNQASVKTPSQISNRIEEDEIMKFLFAAFLTVPPALLALHGYLTGNDFLFMIGGLVALAPATALAALKLKWV